MGAGARKGDRRSCRYRRSELLHQRWPAHLPCQWDIHLQCRRVQCGLQYHQPLPPMKPFSLAQKPDVYRYEISCVVIALCLASGAFIAPSLMPGRHHGSHSGQNRCITNLRQIEAGKEQWALEQGKISGDRVNKDEVHSYIKGGGPTCPMGGFYTYNTVGKDVVCSKKNEGHKLP